MSRPYTARVYESWNGWFVGVEALDRNACATREQLVVSICIALVEGTDREPEWNSAETRAEAGAIVEHLLLDASLAGLIAPLRGLSGFNYDLFVRAELYGNGVVFMAPDGSMGRAFSASEVACIVEMEERVEAMRRSEHEAKVRWTAMTYEERVAEIERIHGLFSDLPETWHQRHPTPDLETSMRNLNASMILPESQR